MAKRRRGPRSWRAALDRLPRWAEELLAWLRTQGPHWRREAVQHLRNLALLLEYELDAEPPAEEEEEQP